jgi:acid phosphatase type 7
MAIDVLANNGRDKVVSPDGARRRAAQTQVVKRIAVVAFLLLAVAGGAWLVADTSVREEVQHGLGLERGTVRAPDGEFVASVPGRRAVLWVVGDADDSREAGALAETIARGAPDRLLYLGDVYEWGSPAQFERWNAIWGRFAAITAPTVGNHDWAESGDGYDPYWHGVTGELPPSYYTFRAGGWEVVAVNSETGDEGQEHWLRDHLRAAAGDCRVVFWHRPRWSAGPRGDQGGSVTELWDSLPGHARLLLSGHEHNLQRLRPVDGVTQLVVGAGGHGHQPVDRSDPRLVWADDRHAGALRLVLEPGRARWSFVAAGGRVLDAGATRCAVS